MTYSPQKSCFTLRVFCEAARPGKTAILPAGKILIRQLEQRRQPESQSDPYPGRGARVDAAAPPPYLGGECEPGIGPARRCARKPYGYGQSHGREFLNRGKGRTRPRRRRFLGRMVRPLQDDRPRA